MHNHDCPDFRAIGKHFKSKLDKIKVLAFDVDGILTTGHIYYSGEEVGYNRFFHVHDGYGMKCLKELGYKVGVISGGNSLGVAKRFKENLNLDFVYLGNEDKREAFQQLLNSGHEASEILYMGDELFDIPLLKRAGFSCTVPSAAIEVREVVDYISHKDCGNGAAREVLDILRYSQGLEIKVEDFK